MSGRNGVEEEEGEPCSLCDEVPESIIYLNCDHKMCLMCTARSVFESGKRVGEEVACPLCKEVTAVSSELQEALEELLAAEDSDKGSVTETSVMAAGSGNASVVNQSNRPLSRHNAAPAALVCPFHADEEFVYFHPSHRRLLCAQCALREGDAVMAELRPLRRCLGQAVDVFGLPFAEAELQAKRIELARAELSYHRQAFTSFTHTQQRRMLEELDELAELVVDFKLLLQRDIEGKATKGLSRFKAAEDNLCEREAFLRGMCNKLAALRSKSSSEASALTFALKHGDDLQRRLEEVDDEVCTAHAKVAQEEIEALNDDLEERRKQIKEAVEIKLRRFYGQNPATDHAVERLGAPSLASTISHFAPQQQKTAFNFKHNPNALLARLQERARGDEPQPPLPAASPPVASSSQLTARRTTPTKPWATEKQLRSNALAYSVLQRRRIDTKLRAAGYPVPL